MNIKFDELTKSLATSVTRRAALKNFGLGIVGMALAAFGLANRAGAAPPKGVQGYCQLHNTFSGGGYTGRCVNPSSCLGAPSADCPVGPGDKSIKAFFACGGGVFYPLDRNKGCSFTT